MNQEKKRKLLSKYTDSTVNKRKTHSKTYDDNNVWVRDQDDFAAPKSSSSSQDEVQEVRRARIQSSDEEPQDNIKKRQEKSKEQKKDKKQRKLKKKLRKALGIGKGAELDQFIENLQIEGIEKSEILEYLKNNKSIIVKEDVKQEDEGKKKKKKKDKKDGNENEASKFKMFEKSQSSDLEIPEQARAKTIYRNKDGTIKDCSQKQQKQKRKQQVLARLAQWQHGMKKQKSDHEHEGDDVQLARNNKIWNDPMRRWEQKQPVKLLTCKFQGPPNRYNIKPGFRWDGVIRGNGFENRYLQEINLKKTKKDKEHMEYMKDL